MKHWKFSINSGMKAGSSSITKYLFHARLVSGSSRFSQSSRVCGGIGCFAGAGYRGEQRNFHEVRRTATTWRANWRPALYSAHYAKIIWKGDYNDIARIPWDRQSSFAEGHFGLARRDEVRHISLCTPTPLFSFRSEHHFDLGLPPQCGSRPTRGKGCSGSHGDADALSWRGF